MKKALLITLFLACYLQSSAQKIRFTDTANTWRWYSTYSNNFNPITTHYTSYYIDSIYSFNGKSYLGLTELGFIREDTNSEKVYVLPAYPGFFDTTEHLLLDYNLRIGDTFRSQPTSAYYAVVNSIDSTVINSVWHKIWYFSSVVPIKNYIVVEGIGSLSEPMAPLEPLSQDVYASIACFEQHGVKPALNPPVNGTFSNTQSCTADIAYIKNSTREVTIYPHPANASSRITFPKQLSGMLTVYNSFGQIIKRLSFNNKKELAIGELPSFGIYYFQISTDIGNIYSDKFVYR